MELNPNHPATQEAHDLWHKLCGILLHKFDLGKVTITAQDLNRLSADFADGMPTIMYQADEAGIHVQLVTLAEGQRLAAEHGGLPS